MNRKDAIAAIMSTTCGCEAVLSSLGLISREIYDCYDAPNKFYVPGSMGLVSSIGIGLAVSRPQTTVIVIDGDASLLMNLGTLVTAVQLSPANFLHIVLDNGVYGSCSEERTMSAKANFEEIARITGFRHVYLVDAQEELKAAVKEAIGRGPAFVRARISLGGRRDFARPLALEILRKRFMDFLVESDIVGRSKSQ
ncbi:sulfopyruvate decarboxylase subunit beta [Patescibacteria group bacterium]|nr:sulfopyruvate decarboxylase subunit beta [Patescibacteria group bacterium]